MSKPRLPHQSFRFLRPIFAASILVLCNCRPAEKPEPPTLPQGPLYAFSESQLDAYLRILISIEPDIRSRVVTIARQTIGQPYRLGLLGEGSNETYDPDPLYCLTASDCVTFVEQTYAMALARDWPSFLQALQRIRYKDGRIGMLSRNHFTEADWNVNNAWLFDDITSSLAGERTAAMTLTIDRKAFFSKHGIGRDIPRQSWRDRYIPRKLVPEIASQLQPADIIEIVRTTGRPPSAPFVGHMGLFMRGPANEPMLLHSGQPAVHEVPLLDYLQKNPNIVGIKVLRLRKPPPQ